MSRRTVTPEIVHPYVERRPNVQGGRPVIRGSRVPISSVVQHHRRGESVEEILLELPQLTPSEVYDALSYYHDHRAEIEAEIGELSDLERAMAAYPPTLRPADRGGD